MIMVLELKDKQTIVICYLEGTFDTGNTVLKLLCVTEL